jgi:HNH endonuclease
MNICFKDKVDEKWKKISDKKRFYRLFSAVRHTKLLKLSESQNHRCCYCSKLTWIPSLNETGKKLDQATIEHLIPVEFKGTDSLYNLAMACRGCNQTRINDFSAEEWYEIREFNLCRSDNSNDSNRNKLLEKLSESQNHRCGMCGIKTWSSFYNETGPANRKATLHCVDDSKYINLKNSIMSCKKCKSDRNKTNVTDLEFYELNKNKKHNEISFKSVGIIDNLPKSNKLERKNANQALFNMQFAYMLALIKKYQRIDVRLPDNNYYDKPKELISVENITLISTHNYSNKVNYFVKNDSNYFFIITNCRREILPNKVYNITAKIKDNILVYGYKASILDFVKVYENNDNINPGNS